MVTIAAGALPAPGGTYAFRKTGVNNVVGGPIAQFSMTSLAEMGRAASFARPEAATVKSETGPISRPAEATWSIGITGSFFDADGTKSNNLVILDGGKRFFLLSLAQDTLTTEEGKRLEVEN
jgi:hypothetical protein